MVKSKRELSSDSVEKNKLLKIIADEEKKAEKNLREGKFEVAKKNYEYAGGLYEKLGDSKNANRIKNLSSDLYLSQFAELDNYRPRSFKDYMSQIKAAVSAFAVFLGMFLIGISTTGNVIGVSESKSGVLGIIILVVGIFGMYRYVGKNK